MIKLSKPFARNGKVDEFDVRQIKKALNRLGYYSPFEKVGITGIPDNEVFEALKVFQTEQGLRATGTAKPEDETVKASNEALSEKKDGKYIWRTVKDGKVRASHAKLNGQIRDFSDSPDPGEDFNCRCWVEPLKKKANSCVVEQVALANASAELFISQQNWERENNRKNEVLKEIDRKKIELADLDKIIEKEKKDKAVAKLEGAAAGGAIGAIMGAPAGPGGSLSGAAAGIGAGSNINKILEEIGDAISKKNETDFTLKIRRKKLLDEIKNLFSKLTQHDKLLNSLLEKIRQEEHNVKQKALSLMMCQRESK